ncbi:MAG: metal ABC transporter permease, partial [Nanoarchaeota archaeon]
KRRIDTLLSFMWSVGMAIGLVFIFMTTGYASDLFTYLFGNILLVSGSDLLLIAVLDIVIIVTVILLYNPLQLVVFDEEYARTRNLPVGLINIILYSLIALTIVATIRLVGIVLMIAILTIPSATASMFFKRMRSIMIVSSLITLVSTVGGLFLSYALDFSTGPIIILLIAGIFLISKLVSSIPWSHIFSRRASGR